MATPDHFLQPFSTATDESVDLHQVAHEFRQEVEYRQAFETYCQWYYATAEQHRVELATMANDIPFLNWFWRRG